MEKQSFWSFASMTFAFANHIWHHASPELRRKVEDFAKPSRGLLTFIQDGPQTSINAKVSVLLMISSGQPLLLASSTVMLRPARECHR